jgi:hypothetical protein
LERQQESSKDAWKEYDLLGEQVTTSQVIVEEIRCQIAAHVKALHEQVHSFFVVADRLVAWKSILVPQLQLLGSYRSELQEVLHMRQHLLALRKDHIALEDEFDAAQVELRKHRRHAMGLVTKNSHCCPDEADSLDVAGAVRCKFERRVSEACEQVQESSELMKRVKAELGQAEAELPVAIMSEDPVDGKCSSISKEPIWPEGQLALKLAELQQKHKEIALHVSAVQAERDEALRQVAERSDKSIDLQFEADLMCPITHERMKEPVLAADGHTYERCSIEKWMQSHQTSPMTGAPLAHRYLTQNFVLRRIIDSYEAFLEQSDSAESENSFVSSLPSVG